MPVQTNQHSYYIVTGSAEIRHYSNCYSAESLLNRYIARLPFEAKLLSFDAVHKDNGAFIIANVKALYKWQANKIEEAFEEWFTEIEQY